MKKKIVLFLIAIPIIAFLVVVFMAIFQLCPPQGPWPMPPWCEKFEYSSPEGLFENQIFLARIDQQKIPMISTERLEKLNAHALGWQGLSVENALFRTGSRQLINTAKKSKMPVISSMNIIYLIRANPIDFPETAALDLDGNPISLKKIEEAQGIVHGTYWRNLLNPDYQKMLLDDAKLNIDVGVDGIVFDDGGTGSASSLIYKEGGSFDDYSMIGFRSFLDEKFTDEELDILYGIVDISDFNFKEYIISNNLEDSWNKDSQSANALTYEFEIFLNQANKEIIKRIVTELKEYASEEYNRDFFVSFNAAPIFPGNFISPGYDIADFLYGEHFWFDKEHIKASVAAKLAENVMPGKYIMLLEVKHDMGELPRKGAELFKYAFADTYSTGSASLQISYPEYWTLREWGYVEGLSYDDDIIEQYAGFLKKNPRLFSLDEPANVAVIQSIASQRLDFLPIEPDLHGYGSSHRQLITITDMLLNLNVPFKTIVIGSEFTALENIMNELSQYEMVIIPNVLAASDEEVNIIMEYVRNGGKVLQLNDFAELNLEGKITERKNIEYLTKKSGEHNLGKGLWITENLENFEMNYLYTETGYNILPTEQKQNNPGLMRLKEIVENHSTSDIEVETPITVNVRRFKDSGRIVLHIVNYDYEHTSEKFIPSTEITIRLDSQDFEISNAKLYDLETGEETYLEINKIGEKLEFVIPSVYAYSIVELE